MAFHQATRLDRRDYGAWNIHPSRWEKRFHELSDPKAVEVIKSRSKSRSRLRGDQINKVAPKVHTYVLSRILK